MPETLIAIVTATFVGRSRWCWSAPLLALPLPARRCRCWWLGTRWYLRRAPAGYLRENAAYSDITDGLAETVEGARTVEALRLPATAASSAPTTTSARSYAAERYTLFLRTVWFPVVEIGYLVPVVATLLVGGWFYTEGWATLGQVTAATLYVQQLIDPVDRLLSWLDELQVGGASLARLLGVVDGAATTGSRRPAAAPRGERLAADGRPLLLRGRPRRAARRRPDGRAGGAAGDGRPVRRRQVDARPAARRHPRARARAR